MVCRCLVYLVIVTGFQAFDSRVGGGQGTRLAWEVAQATPTLQGLHPEFKLGPSGKETEKEPSISFQADDASFRVRQALQMTWHCGHCQINNGKRQEY